MKRSAHDEQRLSAAVNDFFNLAHGRMRNFARHTDQAVSGAYFLNRRGRDAKEWAAHSKENDPFGAARAVLRWRRGPHYRTPTGATRARLRTRFSSAA